MSNIRNSVKAIIIKDGKLLCTKNRNKFGIFYLLPGGGQKKFEKINEALKRECKEEISADIFVKDLLLMREYIGKNHEFAEWDSDVHQIEYMFECELKNEVEIKNGYIPDSMQIGIEWLSLKELNNYKLYPSVLKKIINIDGKIKNKIYLGDIN